MPGTNDKPVNRDSAESDSPLVALGLCAFLVEALIARDADAMLKQRGES